VSHNLTMTDLFAGAGGSSTGGTFVPGVKVRVAANHWQKAVDVHNANHPNADHVCADISQYNPRLFPSTDILWASPECTNHSQAKGRKRETGQPDLFGETLPDEAAERSRATMWDVPRFTEAHRYRAIIVENVIDVQRWEPFDAWLMAMHAFGYEHRLVFLNSMHAQAGGLPAPQSRDRMYVVFWRKGERAPDLDAMQRPKAYCPVCETVVAAVQSWKKPQSPGGRYRSQYVYRCPNTSCRNQIVEPGWLPASAAIDWTIKGSKIGDRDKPLADKTRRRIAAGIARYWGPVHLEAAGHTYDAADPKHQAYGDPNGYYRAWSTDDVLKTLHTIESKGLAIPPLLTPAGGTWNETATSANDVMRTRTARESEGVVFPPFMAMLRGTSDAQVLRSHRSTAEPLDTFAANGQHHGLITPYFGATQSAKSTDAALGTLTTVDRYALITRHYSSQGDGAEMTTPAWEALRTLTTTAQQSVITPGELAAAEATVDDCMFRMLEPAEVAAGMAFPGTYIWEGTRRERVRMAGNAVTPPAARDLIGAVSAAITGEAA